MNIITGTKAIRAANKKAVTSYQKGRDLLHVAYVSSVAHAVEHGDTTLLVQLLDDMGTRSQTRHKIAAVIRQFSTFKDGDKTRCALRVNIDKNGKVTAKLSSKHKEHVNIQELMDTPYWEALEVTPVKAPFELHKAVIALAKRAMKEGYSVDDIKADIDSLRVEEVGTKAA